MNYLEIIGKNLVHEIRVQDYIDWAVLKLEQGFETESIIALVSLMLEVFPEIDIAEQYFTQSIDELGLLFPNDKKAIYAYLHFYCDEVILGKIEPEKAVHVLSEICENINLNFNQKFNNVYHPIMAIWYYFEEDLYLMSIDEYAIFNTGLNQWNIDDYILKVVHQFQYILSMNLPPDFMTVSLQVGNVEWDMRDYEGRVQYLKNTNQNLIFNP
ncbi:hypothetical protein [Acinetobacter sp. WCHAc060025]|uniref:hypothetical protein n=1 Tax=Acinetobacter sp. WCHAc060025 TaxID=2518625 RepID=UPI001023AB5F|nr:hypothetical protein [Acinetobacter sp. WCHAc060025]RZG78105.1 hypothetical protein EXE09_00630 [Acinetobacter sp. WCHAc060025]